MTREQPETGADELLVFDVPANPEFSAMVPGGGIAEGESVEDAAVREAKEETGLDVAFIRELGVAENPGQIEPDYIHVAHYVHATPRERLPDTWEHRVTGDGDESGALVVCRWLPVEAEAEVWGLRGAFIHAVVRKRVAAYVTREREGRTELLVFDHKDMPDVPTQVPAGRVETTETLEEGLVREVEEETGLIVKPLRLLADAEEHARTFGPGPHETFAFHALADPGGLDSWEHRVTGTEMDFGLVFTCRWVPLEDCPPLWGSPDPLVEKLRRSIEKE